MVHIGICTRLFSIYCLPAQATLQWILGACFMMFLKKMLYGLRSAMLTFDVSKLALISKVLVNKVGRELFQTTFLLVRTIFRDELAMINVILNAKEIRSYPWSKKEL